MGRWIIFCLALSGWLNAQAEEAPVKIRQAAKMVTNADVLQWFLALLFVLAIFGVLVWLLRKSSGMTINNKSQLAILGGLSLGMRERLVLIKVGDKQLLLGVTPGRMDKLMELEGEQRLFLDRAAAVDASTFAKKLQQVLQGKVDE